MATRSTNTMEEGLTSLLTSISDLKVTPDADLEFLIGLETLVLGKLREPLERARQAEEIAKGMSGGAGGMPMNNGAMGMPGGPPMAPPPAPAGVGGGVPGIRSEPQMGSPDELRRMLNQ